MGFGFRDLGFGFGVCGGGGGIVVGVATAAGGAALVIVSSVIVESGWQIMQMIQMILVTKRICYRCRFAVVGVSEPVNSFSSVVLDTLSCSTYKKEPMTVDVIEY